MNNSDNEDKLDENTVSEDKSPAKVPLNKKRKTDKSSQKATQKKAEKKGGLRRKIVKRSPLKRMLMTRKRPRS